MFDQQLLFSWIGHLGYIGLFVIIFLESGVFFGFMLPGDSLVFAAGMLTARGVLNIYYILPILMVAAFLGYMFGYWFGDKLGHWLLKKNDSIFFKRSYLIKAKNFYERHGGKALVLGRVIPIVRTFVPIVAGMATMPYKRFMFFNVMGAIAWSIMFLCFGYFLGILFPELINFILPIAACIIVVSILPGLWHWLKSRK